MSVQQRDRKINITESYYLMIIMFSLTSGVILDVFLSLNVMDPYFIIESAFLYTLLAMISSISLIGMTFLSIIISNSKDEFLGMNITEFVTILHPKYFTIKNVIASQLILIFLSVIFLSVNFINTFFLIFFTTLLLIWIMTDNVFSINFKPESIKVDIIKFYQHKFSNNSTGDIDLKKKLLSNLLNYGNNNSNITNQEIKKIDELTILLIEKSNYSDNLKEEIFRYIETEYTTYISTRIKDSNSMAILDGYNSIIRIYKSFNKRNFECSLFVNIYSVYFSSLKNVSIDSIRIEDFSFYEFYEVLKDNYILSEETTSKYKLSYIKRFHSLNYEELYSKYPDYFDLRIRDFTDVSTYNNFTLVDYLAILNLFKKMIELGHTYNYEKYFNRLLIKANLHYNNENESIYNSLIMHLLLYLNYLNLLENTSTNNEIITAKDYLNKNKGEISSYLTSLNLNSLIEDNNYNKFALNDFDWLIFNETGVSMARPLSSYIEPYILWLFNINDRYYHPKEQINILMESLDDPRIINNDEQLKDYFAIFNKLFEIDYKNPEEMVQDLKQYSYEWFKKNTLEVTDTGVNTNNEITVPLESNEIYSNYSNITCHNVNSLSERYPFKINQSTTSVISSDTSNFIEQLCKIYIKKPYVQSAITNSNKYNTQQTHLNKFVETYHQITQKLDCIDDLLMLGSSSLSDTLRKSNQSESISTFSKNYNVVNNSKLLNSILFIDKSKIHYKINKFVIVRDKSEEKLKEFLNSHRTDDKYYLEYTDGRGFDYTKDEMIILFNKFDFTYLVEIEYEYMTIDSNSHVLLEIEQ